MGNFAENLNWGNRVRPPLGNVAKRHRRPTSSKEYPEDWQWSMGIKANPQKARTWPWWNLSPVMYPGYGKTALLSCNGPEPSLHAKLAYLHSKKPRGSLTYGIPYMHCACLRMLFRKIWLFLNFRHSLFAEYQSKNHFSTWSHALSVHGVTAGGKSAPWHFSPGNFCWPSYQEKRGKGKWRRKERNSKKGRWKIGNGRRKSDKGRRGLLLCFVFLLFPFKPLKFVFGSTKWEFSAGKNNFTPGKKSGKKTLPPLKNIPLMPLCPRGPWGPFLDIQKFSNFETFVISPKIDLKNIFLHRSHLFVDRYWAK